MESVIHIWLGLNLIWKRIRIRWVNISFIIWSREIYYRKIQNVFLHLIVSTRTLFQPKSPYSPCRTKNVETTLRSKFKHKVSPVLWIKERIGSLLSSRWYLTRILIRDAWSLCPLTLECEMSPIAITNAKMSVKCFQVYSRGKIDFCSWASYSIPTTGSFRKKCCSVKQR